MCAVLAYPSMSCPFRLYCLALSCVVVSSLFCHVLSYTVLSFSYPALRNPIWPILFCRILFWYVLSSSVLICSARLALARFVSYGLVLHCLALRCYVMSFAVLLCTVLCSRFLHCYVLYRSTLSCPAMLCVVSLWTQRICHGLPVSPLLYHVMCCHMEQCVSTASLGFMYVQTVQVSNWLRARFHTAVCYLTEYFERRGHLHNMRLFPCSVSGERCVIQTDFLQRCQLLLHDVRTGCTYEREIIFGWTILLSWPSHGRVSLRTSLFAQRGSKDDAETIPQEYGMHLWYLPRLEGASAFFFCLRGTQACHDQTKLWTSANRDSLAERRVVARISTRTRSYMGWHTSFESESNVANKFPQAALW